MMSLDSLRRSVPPLLILAAILAPPQPLFAAILPVTNLGDSGMNGQLRTLITLATPGDTIAIPAGTITLAGPAGENLNGGGDLDISKNLTIQGAGPGITIIDGAGIDRVFHIDPSEQGGIEVTISGLTIRNGKTPGDPEEGGGGIKNQSGTVSLTNVTVSANTSDLDGGDIGNRFGTVTLSNVTVSGSVQLKNTIVANSPSGGNCSGTITSLRDDDGLGGDRKDCDTPNNVCWRNVQSRPLGSRLA